MMVARNRKRFRADQKLSEVPMFVSTQTILLQMSTDYSESFFQISKNMYEEVTCFGFNIPLKCHDDRSSFIPFHTFFSGKERRGAGSVSTFSLVMLKSSELFGHAMRCCRYGRAEFRSYSSSFPDRAFM
jgi:hypothetical protein